MSTQANPGELSPSAETAGAPEKELRFGTVLLMAVGVGVTVANLYYAQPLLAEMAASFGVSVTHIGTVAMLSQLGTASGMLLFVPLGDKYDRRSLTLCLLLLAAAGLASIALARRIEWLMLASLLAGAASSAVHVLVPFAAHLAPEKQRGRVVGTVLSGLLVGVLLARSFSGLVGAWLGWRAVYWMAAAAMLLLTVALRLGLPPNPPVHSISWWKLMHSIAGLVRTQPLLRESALLGSLFFCAFSAFWTTLVFLLGTPPYHYGPRAAGLFGLVGAAGAGLAPLIGHFSDRSGPRRTVGVALWTAVAGFVVLWLGARWMPALVAGVLLMDVGVQAGHVANQTRIYSIDPAARSRLNTVYMVSYFLGGAAGSYFGAVAWVWLHWSGVCGLALTALAAALVVQAAGGRRARMVSAPAV